MTQVPSVTLVSIDELKVDGENPNVMSDRQLKALNESVDRFGFIIPIITNKDLLIADGEQRYTVAKSRGMKQVPVVRLDVSDVDRRLLRQVLNKLKGIHQEDLDAYEYLKIVEAGESQALQSLISLSEGELQRHLDLLRDPKPEGELPELTDTDIVRGDVYELGSHRLMCGDATSQDDVKRLMNDDKADIVFTDPPYGINAVKEQYVGRGAIAKNKVAKQRQYMPIIGDAEAFNPKHLLNMAKKTIIFGGNYFIDSLPSSPCWLVWDKTTKEWQGVKNCELLWTNFNYAPRIYRCMWQGMVTEGESGRHIHPTQKPIKLLSEIIKDFTHNPDIILDPYGGSGSTLIACEQTGRRCRMMEIDPRYCQVIINRWQNYTGLKAEKVEG